MTTTLFRDFDERSKEVNKYFIFLMDLEKGRLELCAPSSKTRKVDPELLKTLKASSFLLLYNLVEATMKNAIEAIFDELKNSGVSYDQIRPELKKIVIKNLKSRNPDNILTKISTISLDIINAGFSKDDLFSGNVDGQKIREIATEYGFSHRTQFSHTHNGEDLVTVKRNRNDLAHGRVSFIEVGRDRTVIELLKIKNKVVKYLRQILKNIADYLLSKHYLHSLATGVT